MGHKDDEDDSAVVVEKTGLEVSKFDRVIGED